MKRFKLLALAITLATLATSALAADTIINFDDLSLVDYGAISSTYGSNATNTPNVAVGYRAYNPADNSTFASNLVLWNANYGDLSKVAITSQDGQGTEITFTPDSGYNVTLSSFDMAGYFNNQIVSFIRVVDAANAPLWSSSDPTVLGAAAHSGYSPAVTSSGPLKIQFGSNWNVGIDNITFSQSLIAAPEPGTLALMLLPGALALACRRKRLSL